MGKVPSCDMENVLSFPLAMSLVRFYFLLSTALVLPPQEFCGPSKLFFHPRDPLRRPNSLLPPRRKKYHYSTDETKLFTGGFTDCVVQTFISCYTDLDFVLYLYKHCNSMTMHLRYLLIGGVALL